MNQTSPSDALAALRARKAGAAAPPPVTVPGAGSSSPMSSAPAAAPSPPPPSPPPPSALPPIDPRCATIGKRADGTNVYAWEIEGKSPGEVAAMLATPAPLGINPPEKNLPQAPPVGQAAPAADKPKRGRPAGAVAAPPAAIDVAAFAKAVVDELVARLTGAT